MRKIRSDIGDRMPENKKPNLDNIANSDSSPSLKIIETKIIENIKKIMENNNMEENIPFMFYLASNPNTPKETLLEIFKKLEFYKLHKNEYKGPIKFIWIENALAENRNTHAEVLTGLANDPKLTKKTMYYIALHKNTPLYFLNKLAEKAEKEVEEKLKEASNPNTSKEHLKKLKKLAKKDENYSVLNAIINNEKAPEEIQKLAKKRKKELRGEKDAIINNENAPQEIKEKPKKIRRYGVESRMALARNENIDAETIKYLSKDPEAAVKCALTENPKTPPDVLTEIKNYAIEAIKKSNNKEDLNEYEDILKGVALHNNTPLEDLEELAKYPNDVVKGRVLVNLLNRKIGENIVAKLEKDKSLRYFGKVVRSIISHDNTLAKALEEVRIGKSKTKVMELVEYCLLLNNNINNIQLKLEEYWDFVKFNNVRLNEALAVMQKTPVEILEELAKPEKSKTIRADVAGNSKTLPETLMKLVEQPEIEIKIRLSKNENTPSEALTKLKNYSIEAIKKSKNKEDLENNIKILEGVAKNKNTSTEDLRDLLANFLNKENKEMISTIISNINTPQEDLEALANFLNKEMISTTISNINISQEDFEKMTKEIRLNVARNLNTSSEDLEKLEKSDNDSDVRDAASTTIIKHSQILEAYNYFSLLRQN